MNVLESARSELAYFDSNRDRLQRREHIHHLTRIGMSSNEIAAATGVVQRSVVRERSRPPVPHRPLLYDGASVSQERADQLVEVADLALDLAATLRDEDPCLVWGALARLGERRLRELAVIAIAAIPVDSTRDELLSWVLDLPAAREAQ